MISLLQVLLWIPVFANLEELYDGFHDATNQNRVSTPLNPTCVGLKAGIENCTGCRYDHYSPSSSNIIHETIESTSCIRRLRDHGNRTVFHSATNSLGSLLQSLSESMNMYMSSSINVYLLADGIHELGSNTTSGVFRRMNAYILIKPAYCSEFPDIPSCCKKRHIEVTLTQKMISIFIAGALRIEGLYIRDINYSTHSESNSEAELISGTPFWRLKGLALINLQHLHDDPDPKRAHIIIENTRLARVRMGNRRAGKDIAFMRTTQVPHETVIRNSVFEDIYFTGGLIDTEEDTDYRTLLNALEASDSSSFQYRMRDPKYSESLIVTDSTFTNIDTMHKEVPYPHLFTSCSIIYFSPMHPLSIFTFANNTLRNLNLTQGALSIFISLTWPLSEVMAPIQMRNIKLLRSSLETFVEIHTAPLSNRSISSHLNHIQIRNLLIEDTIASSSLFKVMRNGLHISDSIFRNLELLSTIIEVNDLEISISNTSFVNVLNRYKANGGEGPCLLFYKKDSIDLEGVETRVIQSGSSNRTITVCNCSLTHSSIGLIRNLNNIDQINVTQITITDSILYPSLIDTKAQIIHVNIESVSIQHSSMNAILQFVGRNTLKGGFHGFSVYGVSIRDVILFNCSFDYSIFSFHISEDHSKGKLSISLSLIHFNFTQIQMKGSLQLDLLALDFSKYREQISLFISEGTIFGVRWTTSKYESSLFGVEGSHAAIFTQSLERVHVEGIDSGSFITLKGAKGLCSIFLRKVSFLKTNSGIIGYLAYLVGARTVFFEDCSFIFYYKEPVHGHFAIGIDGVDRLDMHNSRYVNIGGSLGGALYIGVVGKPGNSILIQGCTFENNFATRGFSGDITLLNQDTQVLQDCELIEKRYSIVNTTFRNSKGEVGGAITVFEGCALSIKDSKFESTEATIRGGAISADPLSRICVKSSNFSGFHSPSGGAIFLSQAIFEGSRVSFDKLGKGPLRQSLEGGIINIEQGSTFLLRDSEIWNGAANRGAVAFIFESTASFHKILVVNSSSRRETADFHIATGDLSVVRGVFVSNPGLREERGCFMSAIGLGQGDFQKIQFVNYTNIYSLFQVRGRAEGGGNLTFVETSLEGLVCEGHCLHGRNINISFINSSIDAVSTYNGFIYFKSTTQKASELLFYNSKVSNVRAMMPNSPILRVIGARGILSLDKSDFENNFIHDHMIRVQHGSLFIRDSQFRSNELNKDDSALCLISIASSNLLQVEYSILSVHSIHGTLCTDETSKVQILKSHFDYRCIKKSGIIVVRQTKAFSIQETSFLGHCPYSPTYASQLHTIDDTFSSSMSRDAPVITAEDTNIEVLSCSFKGWARGWSSHIKAHRTSLIGPFYLLISNSTFSSFTNYSISTYDISWVQIRDSTFDGELIPDGSGDYHQQGFASVCGTRNFTLLNVIIQNGYKLSPLFIPTTGGEEKLLLNILNSRFINCNVTRKGSGSVDITHKNAEITIRDSNFLHNVADFGGAISFECTTKGCSLDVINSSFIGNEAKRYGGAIAFYGLNLSVDALSIFSGNHANLSLYDDFYLNPSNISVYFTSEIPCESLSDFNCMQEFLNESIEGANTQYEEDEGIVFRTGKEINLTIALLDKNSIATRVKNDFSKSWGDDSVEIDCSKAMQADGSNASISCINNVAYAKGGLASFNRFTIYSKQQNTTYLIPVKWAVFQRNITFRIKPCPRGEVAGPLQPDCVKCQENFFSVNPMNSTCDRCLAEGQCFGEDFSDFVLPRKAFWVDRESPYAVLMCSVPEACPQQVKEIFKRRGFTCSEGYQGNLCARCRPGYTKLSTQECFPCERGLSLIGRFLWSWTLAIVALRFQIRYELQGSFKATLLRIFADFCGLNFLLNRMHIQWDKKMLSLLRWQSLFTVAPLDIFHVWDCHFTNVSESLPYLMLFVCPIILSMIVYLLLRGEQAALLKGRKTITMVYVIVTQAIYNYHHLIAYTVIGSFFCERLTLSTSFSKVDHEIVCWSREHMSLMGRAILVGTLWLVGIPLSMIYYNFKHQSIARGEMINLVAKKLNFFKKQDNSRLGKAPEATQLERKPNSMTKTLNNHKMDENPSGDNAGSVGSADGIPREASEIKSLESEKQKEAETAETEVEDEGDDRNEERWKRKIEKELVFVRDFKVVWRSWHQVILLRKTVLPLAIMISDRTNIESQVGGMMFILAFFYFLTERSRPYWLKRFNHLDTLLSEIVIAALALKEITALGDSLFFVAISFGRRGLPGH